MDRELGKSILETVNTPNLGGGGVYLPLNEPPHEPARQKPPRLRVLWWQRRGSSSGSAGAVGPAAGWFLVGTDAGAGRAWAATPTAPDCFWPVLLHYVPTSIFFFKSEA